MPRNSQQRTAGSETGPRKDLAVTFLALNDDVESRSIKESEGTVSSHPVKGMSTYQEPLSYFTLTGRNKD